MAWIARLLLAPRRKSQQELAARAAEVIAQVLFDVGIDRFLNGTLLIDRALRVRFVSSASGVGNAHAAVRADTLLQAYALRAADDGTPLAAQARQFQIIRVAEELMAALLSQSATLRALPGPR